MPTQRRERQTAKTLNWLPINLDEYGSSGESVFPPPSCSRPWLSNIISSTMHLYTYRGMTSESSEEDVSVIFRDVIEYTEALTNVLLAWRSGEPPGLPAAVGV